MAPLKERIASDDGGDISSHDGIDMETFSQILEMDEPGDTDFSHSIVFGFFDQARETFTKIEDSLATEDLTTLSSLGHFLKGSSATLGLVKLRDGCEQIQRYGKMENLDGSPQPDKAFCIERIAEAYSQVKVDFKDVEAVLQAYYDKLDSTTSTDNA